MKRYLQFLLLFICGFITLSDASAQTPVAQYSFSGNANDQSTFGNNAIVSGAVLTQDRFNFANSALYFDGVQSTVTVPNATQLNSAATTISFWVKVKTLPTTGEAYIMSHGGYQERWKISLPSHGRPVFTTNSTSGIKDIDTDSVSLVVGVWTHVVMVHDTVNNKIYINGVLKKSLPAASALNKTSKPLGIGYNPIDVANYFNGSLDEVTIFNTGLTDAQVTALYTLQSTVPTIALGKVAYYSFSGSGLDGTTFANHAALSNVQPTTDRFGFGAKAYAFNGINSSVTAANSAPLNSATTTVSFWVKVNALPSGESYLLSYGGYQERWKISLPSHGKPVWSTNNVGTGNSDMDAGDGNALPVGVWKHVVMVHDGVSDIIYIDGVRKATKAVVGALKSTKLPLGIGYSPIDLCCYFNGSLDEITIYNYALSDADITAIYTAQSTSPAQATDLVAEYKLNGSGKDISQFGNDASGSGSATTNHNNLAGNAFNFSGKDSLVAANSVALQTPTTTIAFWAKPNALPASGEVYLMSNGGYQDRWKISMPGHGKPVFTINTTAGIKDMDTDSVPLAVGTWKYVTAVYDGTNAKMYINGSLKKSIAVAGSLNKTNKPFGIGYDPIGGGSNYNGSLEDIKVFNRGYSDAEVFALYTAQSTAVSLMDTLVASYPFNNSGIDISNYGNTAILRGTSPTKDRFGKANKAINTTQSTAYAANSPQLNTPNTTISFWVKVNALAATGEYYLLSHGGYQERWKISLPGHGKPVFTTNYAGGISDMDSGDGNALPAGVWKHVVMVHDGAKDKIYIDGVKKNEKVVVGGLKNTTHPLALGWSQIDSCCSLNGSLDDVQIYSVALTDAQIAALYTAQSIAPIATDSIAPTTPLNLAAMVAFTNVTLSWLPSTDNVGVTGYNVYQNDSLVTTVTGTTSVFAGLKATTKYKFGVTAIDAAGNESAMSIATATTGQDPTPDTIPPTKPTNLVAQTGSNSVQLTWTASTDNRGVVGYVILQDGVVIDTVTTTSKFVGGLTSLTSYTFDVYAFDAAKNKSGQAEATVTTLKAIVTDEPGLVANYPFDGNANDVTPYANNGVIGGKPTFITHTGLGGQAIKFNGSGDTIIVKNAVQLISDYTTFSFWIRVDSTNLNDAEAYIIDFGSYDQRLKISLPQHRKIVFTTNSKNPPNAHLIHDMDSGDGNDLTKGLWWYVTMVHDGTNDIIYVNGLQVNSLPAPGKLNSTARAIGIGGNNVEGGQYFIGALDNLKIYNKALTAAEVTKLFKTGTTPVDDQPTAELFAFVKNIFPNPTSDILTIKHAFTGNDAVSVRVFDISGRQIDQINFGKYQIPTGQFSINVAQYPQGTYLLNFVQDGKSLGALKFIKN